MTIEEMQLAPIAKNAATIIVFCAGSFPAFQQIG
jgi:hypothetical protein